MSEPRVSVVVEWDNVRLAGASRARKMLERLAEELAAYGGGPEVLLVHDGRRGDVAEAEEMLRASGADVRVVSAPGCGYYELKNVGARSARGDVVAFLDSDVVPDAGWLRSVVAPFADSDVGVVAGATSLVEPTGLWSKCVAPTFVFPLTAPAGCVERADRFFANNVAFRRETALAFPFLAVPGTSRVACVALAERLAQAGVVVVRSPAARASHPAPVGLGNTVKRALVHGRDTVVLADSGIGPPATTRAWLRRAREIAWSVVRERRTVGLRPLAVPVAVGVAVAYYGLVGAGGVLARIAPRRARALRL